MTVKNQVENRTTIRRVVNVYTMTRDINCIHSFDVSQHIPDLCISLSFLLAFAQMKCLKNNTIVLQHLKHLFIWWFACLGIFYGYVNITIVLRIFYLSSPMGCVIETSALISKKTCNFAHSLQKPKNFYGYSI